MLKSLSKVIAAGLIVASLPAVGAELEYSAEQKKALSTFVGMTRTNVDQPDLSKFLQATDMIRSIVINEMEDKTQVQVLGSTLLGGDVLSANTSLLIDVTQVPSPIGFGSVPVYKITTEIHVFNDPKSAPFEIIGGEQIEPFPFFRALVGITKGLVADAQSQNSKNFAAYLADTDVNVDYTTKEVEDLSTHQIHGLILMGGDVVSGSTTLTIEVSYVPAVLGFGMQPVYKVTYERKDHR